MIETSSKTIEEQSQTQCSSERIYFQLLEKVGSMGKYQKITIALWCIISYLCGGLMLITPFLFYQDPYQCNQTTGDQSCHDFVCSLPAEQRYSFIGKNSFQTLANKYGDYRCGAESLYLSMIQSVMYSSTIVGYFAMALIGGFINRKLLMLSSIVISGLGLFLTVFSISLQMAGAGLFLASLGIVIAFNGCFIYISQTIAEEYRVKFSVVVQFFYGLGVLSNVGSYYLLRDWKLIFIVFYILPCASVITGIFLIVKDTPIDLVTRCLPEQALEQLLRIAKINRIQNPSITLQEIQRIREVHLPKSSKQQKHKSKGFNLIDLCRYKSLRSMTCLLSVLLCMVTFQFYGPALMIDQFQFDLFLNGLIMGVSQTAAYPLCFILITRVGRKTLAYFCFLISLVCSVILIFLWSPNNSHSNDLAANIGTLVVVFIFRFAITMEYTVFYVYFNELFPTQVRAIGTGVVSLAGGVMIMVNPEIIAICQDANFHIMILFAAGSVVSLVCSYFLPETHGKIPEDVVKELKSMQNPEFTRKGSEIIIIQQQSRVESL